jgi:hypothetical protein
MGKAVDMDKWQAIHSFWSGFGLPAYDETSVPDDAVAPYITYAAETADFESQIPLTASIWYRSSSWKEVSKKADEIARSLNRIIRLDDGLLYLMRGSPFAQRMADPDESYRRIYINIVAEFFTNY